MKKKLFFTFLLVSSICLQAQKVLIDKVNSDGRRFIATEPRGFTLGCFAGNKDTTWVLTYYLGEKREIDKGKKMLIKLSDGEIITLDNEKEIGPLDYETFFLSNSIIYVVQPCYYLSKENILSIIEKGIVKIRIETNIDVKDRTEKDCKRFNKLFAKGYNNIVEALKIKKDLYSDF